MPEPQLVLIDGTAFIHRAYHGLPPLSRERDGFPTGAISGFSNMIWGQIRRSFSPFTPKPATHMAVIFDHPSRNFRYDVYPQYKANRPPSEENLKKQIPICRRATRAFGLPSIEMEGFEADDLIATITRQAGYAGFEVTIISSDKDLMQLVGPMVSMFDSLKNRLYGPDEVFEKWGVYPSGMIDLQALIGDKADNVPGIDGVGQKTAARLLDEWGDLHELLENADYIPQDKLREKLIAGREQVLISKKLVTLDQNVPYEADLDSLVIKTPYRFDVMRFLKEFELSALWASFDEWHRRYG